MIGFTSMIRKIEMIDKVAVKALPIIDLII